jgi:hypothetical protein
MTFRGRTKSGCSSWQLVGTACISLAMLSFFYCSLKVCSSLPNRLTDWVHLLLVSHLPCPPSLFPQALMSTEYSPHPCTAV